MLSARAISCASSASAHRSINGSFMEAGQIEPGHRNADNAIGQDRVEIAAAGFWFRCVDAKQGGGDHERADQHAMQCARGDCET
jgi:hypothetical protein